ncbi:MAG: hypothetical protein LBT16_13010 [Treponema sp.]|jgi:hypothetical protein|nr:hypothetical protein [Treponema sp.]
MTVSKKAVISFVLASILFMGFALAAYTGFFDILEAHFYNPGATKLAVKKMEQDTEAIRNCFTGYRNEFDAILREPAIQRSFLPTQREEDMIRREQIIARLTETHTGLLSVQFIGYRDYKAGPGDFPYSALAVPEGEEDRIILDDKENRILFCHPFSDSLGIYRGTAVFTLSEQVLSEQLVIEGRIEIGETVLLLSDPPAVILSAPLAGRNTILSLAASAWKNGAATGGVLNAAGPVRLDLADTGISLNLFYSRTDWGIYIGRLFNEKLFIFPPAGKILFLAVFYITAFLIIFLLFNLRQDPMTIIRGRINRIRTGILEEYNSGKKAGDWFLLSQELERRREDVRQEIYGLVKHRKRKELEKEIDKYLDAAWNEILAIIGGRAGKNPAGASAKTVPPEDEGTLEEVEAREGARVIEQPVELYMESREGPPSLIPELEGFEPPIEELEGVEDEIKKEDHPAREEPAVLEDLTEFEDLEGAGFSVVPEERADRKTAKTRNWAGTGLETGGPDLRRWAGPGDTERRDRDTVDGVLETSPASKGEANLEPVEQDTPMNLVSQVFRFNRQEEDPEPLLSVRGTPEQFRKDGDAGTQNKEEKVIEKRNGIDYINKFYLTPTKEEETKLELDRNFKNLVESVFRG